jgi:hypothetical protein
VAAAAANTVRHREASQEEEVQLLTIRDFDPNVRVRIGGLVTARSVKYLGNLASSLLDQETRDSWWNELRDEIRCESTCFTLYCILSTAVIGRLTHFNVGRFVRIRAHAKILCCSHVVGYLEGSTIHDDSCVLSITGTAAR